MKYLIAFSFLFLLSACSGQDMNTVKDNVDLFVKKGEFGNAESYLKDYIEKNTTNLNEVFKKELEFEIERLNRIKGDFPYVKKDILEQAKRRIKDFQDNEFDLWRDKGLFDIQIIDGEEHFPYACVSNLFFRSPEIYKRKLPVPDPSKYENTLYENCVNVKKEAAVQNSTYVLPKKYKAEMKVTVKKDIVEDGELIKCWIPFPREYPYQNEIKFLGSTPDHKKISDPGYPARSVFLEGPGAKDSQTEFKINYQFTRYSVYFQVDPQKVKLEISDKYALKYTEEQPPHVLFTKPVADLSKQIVGDEKNPYLKAKKIYKWISSNFIYSYMIEYSTIRHIPEYIIERGYGDCGVHALLFITLCRHNGIPARWQSAWYLVPGHENIHDWAEFYVEPYGWIPCDPDFGVEIYQHFKTLTKEQKDELNDFYFTGLDHFRMTANCDHNQKLDPGKKTFRSDNVDFQRGEVETAKKNIYFGRYRYRFNYEVIDE